MQTNSKVSFNTRAFIAITAAVAGLGLPITGYENHIFQFYPMTVQRHAWMSAHNILAIIFSIFTIWHIILNRRALLRYAKGAAAHVPFIRREAILAICLVGLCLLIVVGHALH